MLAPGESCYDFLVSRIRLPLAVRFTKHEPDKYVSWVLDRPSWILRESTGFWHVQPVPERQGYVRIWFCVAVRLTARVPGFVVSLVSRVGLRKACFWVRRALEGDDGGDELLPPRDLLVTIIAPAEGQQLSSNDRTERVLSHSLCH